MTYLEGHVLYYKKPCKSCQRVLSFMNDLGVRMRTCDVSHPGHLKDLINLTGRRTVPCLMVHGKATYGEREILRAIRSEVLGFAPMPEWDAGEERHNP